MQDIAQAPSGTNLLFGEHPLNDWQLFFQRVFNDYRGFHDVEIPKGKENFDWLVLVPKSMTISRVVEVSRHYYPVSIDGEDEQQTSLFITHHDRFPHCSYAIWVRSGIEADPVHDRKSAHDLIASGIPGITLLERLLLGLFYHWTLGEHLDQDGITLCSGSRYVDDGVPTVSWYGDEGLQIAWHKPDRRWPTVACREVCGG